MEWLFPIPILALAAPTTVAVLRRRVGLMTVGLALFSTGYVAILLADDRGANSPWHLLWLTGLAVLGLGIIPRAAFGSWWERRYGSHGPCQVWRRLLRRWDWWRHSSSLSSIHTRKPEVVSVPPKPCSSPSPTY